MFFGRPRRFSRPMRPFPAPSALAPSFSLCISGNSRSSQTTIPPGPVFGPVCRRKSISSPRTSTLFREKATFSRRKSTYRMSFHRIIKWRFSRETSRAFAGPVPEIAHPERSASPQEPRELRNCCGLAKAWRRAHGIRDTELRPGESTLTESVS